MNDMKKLFNERVQLFKDSARHKKTDRVFILDNIYNWKIYDAGYKTGEACRDYKIYEDVTRKLQEKYQFDSLMEPSVAGVRNPLRISDVLGSSDYYFDDEKDITGFKSDISYMKPDEYKEAVEDLDKYLWTKLIPRKIKKLNGPDAKDILKNTAIEFAQLSQYIVHINRVLAEEYGVPPLIVLGGLMMPFFELAFLQLRGQEEISLDIHRQPEEVKEACDAYGWGPAFKMLKANTQKGTNMDTCADLFTALLGHSLLSPKQFEIYYWPYLKEMFEFLVQYDKILYIFAEHNNERFYDFFQEAPKGHVVMHLEMDDIFKAKKAIGDKVCIAGGMPVQLLYYGTKEENISYAKRLIDELAGNGGFIFSTDKMVNYPNDCKSENLKAVTDFVREYKI